MYFLFNKIDRQIDLNFDEMRKKEIKSLIIMNFSSWKIKNPIKEVRTNQNEIS